MSGTASGEQNCCASSARPNTRRNRRPPRTTSRASKRTAGTSERSEKGMRRIQLNRKDRARWNVYHTDGKLRMIDFHLDSVASVRSALRQAGLETSQLILGVDFTSSNAWQGQCTFEDRALHAVSRRRENPYEQTIRVLGETLGDFSIDGKVAAYGFGCTDSRDKKVFSFLPRNKPCKGIEEVLHVYRQLARLVRMSGPTSFAPIIRQAIEQVKKARDIFHILVILTDGQVTRADGRRTRQERATRKALVDASRYPLGIVIIGIGDGPWVHTDLYSNQCHERLFDNCHDVYQHDVMHEKGKHDPEGSLALACMQEIPFQVQAVRKLGLLDDESATATATATASSDTVSSSTSSSLQRRIRRRRHGETAEEWEERVSHAKKRAKRRRQRRNRQKAKRQRRRQRKSSQQWLVATAPQKRVHRLSDGSLSAGYSDDSPPSYSLRDPPNYSRRRKPSASSTESTSSAASSTY